MQSQKAVTAYFSSKQLLPFRFAEHICNVSGAGLIYVISVMLDASQ